MKKNTSWFSIIIGMSLVLVLSITAYVLLSHIIPFSKNVKGIENASNAYYTSYAWIEQALYHVKKRLSITTETGSSLPTTATGFAYQTYSSWLTIPSPWKGNSEYSTGYNVISMTDPIQLEVGRDSTWISSLNWSGVNFIFKVPSIRDTTTLSLSWDTLPIINWMLSTSEDTLYASGTYIIADDINNSNGASPWNIDSQDGFTLTGSIYSFQDFFDDNCNGIGSGCVLKLSVVNPLLLNDAHQTPIPYLEYKITFPYNFPDRYTVIESTGKSYGFQKNLEVQVPQQTVNQALDFTVFQ